MIGRTCEDVRMEVTEYLMSGRRIPARQARHAERCPECIREVREVLDVLRTFQRSEPVTEWSAVSEGPGLHGAKAAGPDVPSQQRRARPSPLSLYRRGVLLSAAAALTGVLGLVGYSTHDRPGTDRVSASAVHLSRAGTMVPKPWGTEVPVALSGLEPEQTYHFMTEDASGVRAEAGTVRVGSGGTVHTRMVTAMPRDAIVALVVNDQRGRQVAEAAVPPRSDGHA